MVEKFKKLIMFAMIFFIYSNISYASKNYYPEYVDSYKFSGKWFEIARTYNNFQKSCKDSFVEYVYDKNIYNIKNICRSIKDNSVIDYHGVGRSANDNESNFSKIKMTYFYVFSKEYQVVFNDNYKIAVISDDTFNSVWIMSRNEKIEQNKLNDILKFLEKHIDIDKLIFENRG